MPSKSFELEHCFLEAGAGAGKTTRLIQSIYDWANLYHKEHGKYPNLVVCTFTIKATQELRDRLSAKAVIEGNLDFLNYVNDKSKLFVSTISGILNRFLKSNALKLGLDPMFRIQSQEDEYREARFIFYQTLKPNPQYKKLLNYYPSSDLLNFCLKFYRHKISGENIGVLSKEDLKEGIKKEESRLLKKIGDAINDLQFILSILKEAKHKKIDDFEEVFKVLKRLEGLPSLREANTILSEVKVPNIRKPEEIKEPLSNIKAVIKELKHYSESGEYDLNFWLDHAELNEDFLNFFNDFSNSWHEFVRKNSFITLNNLEEFTKLVLDSHSNLAKDFSANWDYWFIDEFQDTSRLQVNILNRLIGDKPYFVVGDKQQSIYLFRGSDVSVFDEVKEFFQKQKYHVEKIDINYRSEPNLLCFINDIFESIGFQGMQKKEGLKKDYEAAKIFLKENEEEQYEAIALEIKALIENDSSPSEVGVLARTNKDLKSLEPYFQKYKIPFVYNISDGFFEKRLVKDILYFIKFLFVPHATTNLIHLLRSPIFKIKDDILFEWSKEAKSKDISLWNLVKDNKELEDLKSYWELSNQRSWLDVTTKMILEKDLLNASYAYDENGVSYSSILKLISWLCEKEKNSGTNITNIIDQIFLGENFEQKVPPSPDSKRRVQLMTVHKSKGLQFDHVFLVNADKAFRSQSSRNYFLIAKDQNLHIGYPYGRDQKKTHSFLAKKELSEIIEDERREHLRLFYVAVTRAIKKVYFGGLTKKTFNENSWLYHLPSFLHNGYDGEFYSVGIENRDRKERVIEDQGLALSRPLSFTERQKGIRFSVSDLQELKKGSSGEQKHNSKTFQWNLLKSSYEGNKIHQELELLKYNRKKEIEEKYKEILQHRDIPLNAIIEKGFSEWGFACKLANHIFEGKVDLWAIVANNLWIVDYKSGSEKYIEDAFFQLNAYSLPLRKFNKKETAKIAVVYPNTKKVYIKDAMNLQEVEDYLSSSASALAKRFSKPNPI